MYGLKSNLVWIWTNSGLHWRKISKNNLEYWSWILVDTSSVRRKSRCFLPSKVNWVYTSLFKVAHEDMFHWLKSWLFLSTNVFVRPSTFLIFRMKKRLTFINSARGESVTWFAHRIPCLFAKIPRCFGFFSKLHRELNYWKYWWKQFALPREK